MYANCDYANVVAGMNPEQLKQPPCRWLLVSSGSPLIHPCYCPAVEAISWAVHQRQSCCPIHRFVVITVITDFLTSICQGSPLSALQFINLTISVMFSSYFAVFPIT